MKSENNNSQETESSDLGTWMVYGLIFGTLVGIFLNKLVLGMIFGLCGGILIGSMNSIKEK